MNQSARCLGITFLLVLGLGVHGVQAQQPVVAEPQAPSGTVQAPREVVPALPVPRLVKFAGTLKDELGKTRAGVVGLTFAIYKEQEGGAALWLETQNVELDEQGRYTVLLGATKSDGLPLELFTAGEPRWLGVQVNLAKELEQPRMLLVSVPYALKAADAETLAGKPLSSFVLANPVSEGSAGVGTVFPTTGAIGAATIGGGGTQNFVAKFDATGANVVNSSIFDTGTNVGIGTSSPARTLHLKSAAPTIRLEDTNLPNSFWELQQSAFVLDTFGFLRYENGTAVADKSFVVSSAGNLGIGTGTPQRKLHIRSATPVIRLEDTNLPNSFWELQQSAFVLDTFGFLRYENGSAVQSKSFVMSSAGNFGIGTGAPTQKLEVAGNVKISGAGNALTFPDGTVMSTATAGVGGGTITGVTAGTGLTGGGTAGGVTLGIANGGVTNALLGANSVTNANIADGSLSPAKISGGFATLGANNFLGNQNVVAMSSGATGLSVQTTDLGTANIAINGLADGLGGTGVIGEAENGSLAIGVWGISSTGVAGQFSGNVNITGNLSKAGGSFKIDDPVDPANKYLYHSFVESPDMKNIYDGVTNLDAQGEAVVQLPVWFGVLNREFRYQLTCIGGFAPIYIAEEISENRFKIAGGKPGMKISWMVTGIRKDAWANAHRIPVEEDKPAQERGYYLHPELYGQPRQKSTEWATHPDTAKKEKPEPR